MENYITISAGDTLTGALWNAGEIVTVASGGTISDAELTYRADSLTLAAGAVISGTLSVAAPVTVQGSLKASEAEIVWNISKRKEEEELLWSDLAATGAKSYAITVSPNQDKGTYRIAGNAAAFNGTITVRNSGGVVLGTLSPGSNVLDFDITRYTLGINEAGELTITISSNITDDSYYAFLYKNNQLVKPLEEAFGLEISGEGIYDHLVLIENGIAGDIALRDNGVLTVYAGAFAVAVDQSAKGKLRFDYSAGDSTIITGTNQYGSFLVQDDYLYNVQGENVNLSGDLVVENYYTTGVFSAEDGVDISGVFLSQGTAYFRNGVSIHDCSVSGSNLNFEKGVTVTDSTITSGNFRGGVFTNVTISTGEFFGGTFANAVWGGGRLRGYVNLTGTLTVNGTIGSYLEPYFLDAAGNTIILDYTGRTINDSAYLPGQYVSEDAVFVLNLHHDQGIGVYQVLGAYDFRSKYSFTIRVNGEDLGTLTQNNQSFECGNYVYTMTSGKTLDIAISPNADETFNVLYWRPDGIFGHSVDLFNAAIDNQEYKEVIVRTNGIAGDLLLKKGGTLEVYTDAFAIGIDHRDNAALRFNYSAGDFTLLTGVNQYGLFLVQDDFLMNVIGENVNLSGAISVQDYRSTGKLSVKDGVFMTGTISCGNTDAIFSGEKAAVTIADATITGSYSKTYFLKGVSVTDSTINGARIEGGTYTNVSISGNVWIYGGTYANAVWQSGSLWSAVELAGTLTIAGNINAYGGVINANGHTVALDYTNRTVADGAIFSQTRISEDVTIRIDLADDQTVGTYKILSGAGRFEDTFQISVGGEIIGSIKDTETTLDVGNYTYTMGRDAINQIITLTIDISENADERFNVLCYNAKDELFYAPEMTTVVIDGTNCSRAIVRNGGWLANTKLQNGLLTVRKGGYAYGLDQSANGKLRFDYTAGDDTLITGINQYGSFLVENDLIYNVAGENVTVTGDVTIREYHSGGIFLANGCTITDHFYGSGSFANATITDADITGTGTVSGTSEVSDSTFAQADFSAGFFETVTVTGSANLSGGTYSDVTLAGGGSIRGRIALDGRLIIGNTITCVSSYNVNGAIDAAGEEVNLDLTARTPITEAMINLDRVYNADLTLTVYANQTLGEYTIGSNAEFIGQGDNKGYWDIDTNTWLYKDAVQGDLDSVITIRSTDGIELARCTVNGDTEFFGRYNYRIYTDEDHNLKLHIGWNNREDVTFAADRYDNNTFATATVLEGSGIHALETLTIHDANDVDFYKFTLERSGTASSCISIEFQQWAGDLDIDLYDANDNRVDYAHSVTNNEFLSLQGLAAGDYYVKVYGDSGNTNGYTLSVNLPVLQKLTDAYEKGNTPDKNTYLAEVTSASKIHASIATPGDEDYYVFDLERKGTASDSITLTFDPEYGDLDLYLYDLSGNILLGKSIQADGGTETLNFQGFGKGSYLAKVVAKNGRDVADYDLSFTIRSGEISPDRYEKGKKNNSMNHSTNLYALHGKDKNKDLSIHSAEDVDYFRFKLKETGSADDWIAIDYEVAFGDLDIEILDENGDVVAWSRSAENNDTVSLKGLVEGDYFIRVTGYNGVLNTYDMSWNITNSSLIPADPYEGTAPLVIAQNQTIRGLSIAASPKEKDETRADVFEIQLSQDAWNSSKIILTDFRSDWEEGMAWTISSDAKGKDVIASGTGSEISLAGLTKGSWYLTVDAPRENEYSEYSVIAQRLPDGGTEIQNNWSIFVYLAGDNNLEGAYLTELLWMQQAILPEGVEVYVLMDRHEGYAVGERNWTDTRVGKLEHSPGGAIAVQWMYFDGENTSVHTHSDNLAYRKEWDTGNVDTLKAFLDWGMKTGRADNYALIMKDHGTSLGYNSSDETSGSIMGITDIADLLSAPEYDALKVVAFDQCLMGSDVVISTMEGNVDYVVASESVGWTPNLLVMYKVLFNSLSADMTSQELAQKIVAACNCSGRKDLTLASFHAEDSTLSGALKAFAQASANFTRADWVEICKSFALAYNYGDDICAYSDLGFMLSTLMKSNISTTLQDAAQDLYDTVIHEVIDSTMITPASYGTGFAVFNPVQSDELMSFYSYGPGANLDYYGTVIGQSDWGKFLYNVGQLADDCSEYFVDNGTQITFTDFSYSFVNGEVQVNYNLGEFYGDGVDYKGLYLDDAMYFTITVDAAGIVGDAIRVVADNPDANITLSLVQQRRHTYPGGSSEIEFVTRRVSENGVLSLAGVDAGAYGEGNYDGIVKVLTDYILIVSTDQETTCDLTFEANWTSGSDYFDYSRSGNQLGKQGNGSREKATALAAGNYQGLVTYDGDADYYLLNTVYAPELTVTITGTGLTVREIGTDGSVLQKITGQDGMYTLKVKAGNYLCVEGSANLAANAVNSYSMLISDTESTYLQALLPELPTISVSADQETMTKELQVSVTVSEGAKSFYSTNLSDWTEFTGNALLTANGCYYFKAADTETGLESSYTSLEISNIIEPPEIAYVNSSYTAEDCGGHTWGVDAFATIEAAKEANAKEIRITGGTLSGTKGFAGSGSIESGTIKGMILGNYRVEIPRRTWMDTEGAISLTIRGGTFSTHVIGGSALVQGCMEHKGDITMAITGGTFAKQVAGGMYHAAESRYDLAILTGDVNFTISGGTFNARVYGGNFSREDNTFSSQASQVGDVNLTIDTSENVITFAKDVVAGARWESAIDGNVNLTLTGLGSNLKLEGYLWGGCSGDHYIGKKTVTHVTGSRNLRFDGFTGDLTANVRMFSTIGFTGNSSVNFIKETLNFTEIEVWDFQYGCSMATVGRNDFAGDTLNFDLTGFEADADGIWEMYSGSLNGLQDAKSVTLGGQKAAWTDAGWASADYLLEIDGDDSLKLSKLA